MLTLETKKINLISKIIEFNNEQIISELEAYINKISLQLSYNEIFNHTKTDLNIDKMIIDRNYKGADKLQIEKISNDLNIQEPISQLISML